MYDQVLHPTVKFFKSTLLIAGIFLSLAIVSHAAQAVVIDFDDLTPGYPDWPQDDENSVSDQYLSRGLLIDDAHLAVYNPDYEHIVSSPNYLFGGNFMTFTFVGERPVYVGFNISSVFDYANILHVYGPNGLISRTLTTGSTGAEENTPFVPWEFISFSSPTGITEITFEGFYNMRWGSMIDNLTYEYASVPEPPSLMLFFLGLFLVAGKQLNPRRAAR